MGSYHLAISAFQNKAPVSEKIIVYWARHGEIAIKFQTPEACQEAMKKIGGIVKLKESNPDFVDSQCSQFTKNPEGKTPAIYDNNPDTLYFPAYKAGGGEIAINLGKETHRRNLTRLFLGNGDINGLYSTYSQQPTTIFFDPKHPIFASPGCSLEIEFNLDIS